MDGPLRYRGSENSHVRPQWKARETQDLHSTTTDRTRWRLLDEEGRQTWVYLKTEQEVEEWPLSVYDRHHLGLDLVCAKLSGAFRQSLLINLLGPGPSHEPTR